MHVSLWVMQGSASCQNSPCFQCEDTIDVVLALWPRNSWLSVSLNTRVTLWMGWWKPSWCQCWIHSDMFIHQLRITPAIVCLMLWLWGCVEVNCAEKTESSAACFFTTRNYNHLWSSLIWQTKLSTTLSSSLNEYIIYHVPPTSQHGSLFLVPVCVVLTVQTHFRDFQDIVFHFPFVHGVRGELQTSSPSVSGKDKGVFLRFSDSVHVFLVSPLPLKQSQ